ncbi:MAG: N-acetyltransferase [Pseudomonadota bacterium]
MSAIDWEIRPYEEGDAEAIDTLLRAAFATGAEADLTAALRTAGDAEIEFLADADGTLIGHVLLSRMRQPAGTLALAPVATSLEHRHQGVAASLIESALAQATANDWRGVFVLGDLSYYERFGFESAAAAPFASPYSGEHFGLAILDDDELPKGETAQHAESFGAL